MAAQRLHDRPYKKTEPDEHGFYPLDGVAIWAALTRSRPEPNPEDDFLSDQPVDLTPSEGQL